MYAHLDAPWRPRDIEQREGRILGQGNDNPEIQIHRYVTEGSFDAYMWQVLETKARFINRVMNGSVTARQAEDLEGGALTYADYRTQLGKPFEPYASDEYLSTQYIKERRRRGDAKRGIFEYRILRKDQ